MIWLQVTPLRRPRQPAPEADRLRAHGDSGAERAGRMFSAVALMSWRRSSPSRTPSLSTESEESEDQDGKTQTVYDC